MYWARFLPFSFLSTLIFCGLISSVASANNYPPKPSSHFYGDANGDTGVTGLDLVQHQNFVLSKSSNYDTLQPQTSGQRWNTCDINSDWGCSGADAVQMSNFLLSMPVEIGAGPWALENVNLPLTGNDANVWLPFSVNLISNSTSTPSGRPGISVVAEIDPASPGTGELSGRSCAPLAGSRDQASESGAQCALAVTVTDWASHPEQGLTESGSYGLQLKGDGNGDLWLKIFISAIPGLDVPATSLRLTVSFTDAIDISCPASVGENQTISCAIAGSGLSTCAIGPNDTCGGAIDAGCVGPYEAPAAGEAAGPGSCVAEVIRGTYSDSAVVSILDVNELPVNNAPTSLSGNELTEINFSIAPTDSDIPVQTLTCSLNGTTCPGGSLTDCNYLWIPAEIPAPLTCDATTEVCDGVDCSVPVTTTITVNKVNNAPQWLIPPYDTSISIEQSYEATNGVGMDSDSPNSTAGDPGKLECSKGSQTCSFIVDVASGGLGNGVVTCRISFTAGVDDENCSVSLRITDGAGATVNRDFAITVRAPKVWYVHADAVGANNGNSWADAFNILQDAVDAASGGDSVWVQMDTYTRPNGGGSSNTEPVLIMKDGVKIYGGFQGFETDPSQRGDTSLFITMLNGQYYSEHVVVGASNALLDGFTIVGGNGNGGGIYNDSIVDTVISNCIIKNNKAYTKVMYCCTVDDYTYDGSGAGIYNRSSTVTLKNCTVRANMAGSSGGGIFNELSNVQVDSCTIIDNMSKGYSSVFYDAGMTHYIVYRYEHGTGGGISDWSSTVEITNSIISNNASGYGGAVAHAWDFPLVVKNSTVTSNSALCFNQVMCNCIYGAGSCTPNDCWHMEEPIIDLYCSVGGISAAPLSLAISNTIEYNNHSYGGTEAFSCSTGTDPLFVKQIKLVDSGQLYSTSSFSSTLSDSYNVGDIIEVYNDGIARTITGKGTYRFDFSPALSYYSEIFIFIKNYGPAPTDLTFDFHLQAGSPCENSGTSLLMPRFDIENNPRPMGGGYDMGAYERAGALACADGVDNDFDDLTDFPSDPGCADASGTSEYGNTDCHNGVDNDGDTLVDLADPECASINDPSETALNQCADGIDNDGDTLTDWPADQGCASAGDADELTGAACDDGLDNDGDTLADWLTDPGCADMFDSNEHLGTVCDDGIDNDGDTLFDWQADPGCVDIYDISEGACHVQVDCPTTVGEMASLTCPVTYSACTDTLSIDSSNTCEGASVTDNGNSTGTYEAQPAGEEGGGTSCVAAVEMQDDGETGSDTIDIVENNTWPDIWINQSDIWVSCDGQYREDLVGTASDPDLPNSSSGDPGYLMCSAESTCGVVASPSGTGGGYMECVIQHYAPPPEYCGGICEVNLTIEDGTGFGLTRSFQMIAGG